MIQLKHTQPSHDGSNYKLWAILTPCAHPGDRAVCPPWRQSCVRTALPLWKSWGFFLCLLVVGRIVPPQDVHILTLRIYKYITWHGVIRDSLVAQMYRMPVMLETWVRSLGREDPLEKEMTTHSSILAWKIPLMEEPGGLQSMGSQRVRHN